LVTGLQLAPIAFVRAAGAGCGNLSSADLALVNAGGREST
jgi:hypothetical protein